MAKTQIQGNSKQIQNDNLQEHVKSGNTKTTTTLEPGVNTTTIDPGKLYPIMYKEVLAGETIEQWDITNITRLLTPLVPNFDRAYIDIKAFFVPHTRVWTNFEKAMAQKEALDTATKNLPTFTYPSLRTTSINFRETLAARYGVANRTTHDTTINVLLPRGYRAIFNDFIINKEYEQPLVEWNEDSVVLAEQNALLAAVDNDDIGYIPNAYVIEAAQTRKNYLNNIKKNIDNPKGSDADWNEYQQETEFGGTSTAEYRPVHLDWQTKFMQAKQNIDNANKNDWDIIAEMGGVAPVKADRVEYLGNIEYEMNYQQITQSAPAIDNSSPLGTTGAFSYTKATGTLFNYKKFQQHGFIHILFSITIDNNFIDSTPKELLKTNIDDIYRPALAKKEIQLLLEKEIDGSTRDQYGIAYQPAWAEYKRLPKLVSGDMRETLLSPIEDQQVPTVSHWHNFKTRNYYMGVIDKNYFRPYTATLEVFERNNIFTNSTESMERQLPFMSISEHNVKTLLPIQETTLKANSKAEQTR